MTRILHLGKFFPPFAGGIENFLADLIPAQRRQGDRVQALVHAHSAAWHPWPAVRADVPPYTDIFRAPCYGRLLYAPVSPQFPWWLHAVIRQTRPQVLHIHMPNTSAFWALLLPVARRLPWVVHWHADVVASLLDTRLAAAYRLYRPFEQRLLQRSRAILVTSPPYLASSTVLQSWQDKCHIVPLGVDPARMPAPDPAALAWAAQQWGDSKLRILSVGRMTYYKGHEILIQAAAQVPDSQVLLVGHGELLRPLKALVQVLGLGERVRLPGFCDSMQLAALFATCECFVLTSLERTEAFGVVLMEAMFHAKAVVASAIAGSGVTWVVEDGQSGFLVPPGDVAALAAILNRLRNDQALRQSLGEAGRQRFTETFHIDQVAARVGTVYQTVK